MTPRSSVPKHPGPMAGRSLKVRALAIKLAGKFPGLAEFLVLPVLLLLGLRVRRLHCVGTWALRGHV